MFAFIGRVILNFIWKGKGAYSVKFANEQSWKTHRIRYEIYYKDIVFLKYVVLEQG